MLKLVLELDGLDYDALADRFLPLMTEQLRRSGNPLGMLLSNGMSPDMAKNILRTLPQETKDRLAADLVNQSAPKLSGKLEELADGQGVRVRIRDLHAETDGV